MLIRRRLGLSQAEFGTRLGVSREWVSRTENSSEPSITVTAAMSERMGELAKLTNETPLQERSGEYKEVQLNPKHLPPLPEPTEQQLADYFFQIVGAARRMPGGRGYILAQLRKHLSPEELKKLSD